MIIKKKTSEDLSEEEIDIFINNYPYKTNQEMQYLMKLDPKEIEKTKKKVESEKDITLTKNPKYISKEQNPPKGNITLIQKVLNGMEEKDRREMIEFARNLPSTEELVKQLISIQTARLNIGVSAELANPNMGLDKYTEEAVANYFQMVKGLDEIQNGIKMNHNIEHSFAQMIKEATQRNKQNPDSIEDDIVVEASKDSESIIEEEIDLDNEKSDNLISDEDKDNLLLGYLEKKKDK